MAYSLRYTAGYTNIHGNTGKVDIYEDGGVGLDTLTLRHDSVKIKYNWENWDEPIIGLTASFSIVNEESDFFDLLPLMTSEERKYMVVIEEIDKAPNKIYFKGFLDCKDMSQKYLQKQDIKFNASGYLSKLQYVYTPTVETLENDTFINIILDSIDQTGVHPTGFAIRVNCSLYAVGAALASGQTLFSKCGVYKETFWKDNIERDSALEIIKKILSSFDCYLYWWNDYYWIERYADIWETSPSYVTYVSGTQYYPPDTGSSAVFGKTITDFVSLTKVDTSQTISIITGQKQVEINIEQQRLFNFVNNDYANAIEDNPALANPKIGEWILWTDGSDLTWPETSFGSLPYVHGDPFRNITTTVFRYQYEPDVSIYAVAGAAVWKGNYTRFRTTVTDESVLTIKFKFGTGNNPFAGLFEPADFTIRFYWYLRNPDGALSAYIHYNEGTEVWERTYSAIEAIYVQYIEINGAELDPELWTTEVTISIPLHEPYDSEWGGDQDFILCLGMPVVTRVVGAEYILFSDYRGDVEITMNSALDDNYISGVTNTKFLNKKTLTQHFADISDLGLKNGIYYGEEDTAGPEDLDIRSSFWDDSHGSSGEMLELAEMKIKDKFRLYNVSRQKLTATIKAGEEFYKPLSLFNDSNQDDSTGGTGPPQFVLVGYIYDVQSDNMDIILSEYDNEEQINLI